MYRGIVTEEYLVTFFFYILFLITPLNICCAYSLEAPRHCASNEYPQHMFNRKNKNIIGRLPYLCLECWFGILLSGIQNLYIYRWSNVRKKKVREKSRECHSHKPQTFPDTKRKRKQTKPNKQNSNKRTKSTKISSLFPKRGNRKAQGIEIHMNRITLDKPKNKSPRRIYHKATKGETNTGTTALERSIE